MWYAIYCEDIGNSLPLRQNVRPAHLDRLQALQDQGRLMTAGPFPAIDSNNSGELGFTGSLIIAEFDSLSDAKKWADEDPYTQAGVFAKVTVKPFKKIF